jgi:hypothetical protein
VSMQHVRRDFASGRKMNRSGWVGDAVCISA